MDLSNKHVVVTGTGRGIGRALVDHLIARGCSVAGIERREDLLEEQRKKYPEGRFLPIPCDLNDFDEVRKRVEELLSLWGRVDIFVSNAGVDRVELFVDSRPKTWDFLIAVNFLAPLHCVHALLPSMIGQKKGRILFVASDAGRVGSSGEAVYSGCKGGIIAFAKALAREVARYNITVNCISPGPTETPGFHEFFSSTGSDPEAIRKIQEGLVKAIPLKRMATPEDIVPAILFLISDEAGYITGQTLSVSGGLVMI